MCKQLTNSNNLVSRSRDAPQRPISNSIVQTEIYERPKQQLGNDKWCMKQDHIRWVKETTESSVSSHNVLLISFFHAPPPHDKYNINIDIATRNIITTLNY